MYRKGSLLHTVRRSILLKERNNRTASTSCRPALLPLVQPQGRASGQVQNPPFWGVIIIIIISITYCFSPFRTYTSASSFSAAPFIIIIIYFYYIIMLSFSLLLLLRASLGRGAREERLLVANV